MTEREVLVLAMRNEGKSFREIARHLGVSVARVGQIYNKAKLRAQQAEAEGYVGDDEPLIRLGLSMRSHNALHRVGIDTIGAALEFVKSGQFSGVRNFGPTAYEELREKLKAHHRLE